jgi:hypothetical protein
LNATAEMPPITTIFLKNNCISAVAIPDDIFVIIRCSFDLPHLKTLIERLQTC